MRAGREQVEQWLTHLATVKNVSPTSQNTGFQAVLFMYRELLDMKIENNDDLHTRRASRRDKSEKPVGLSSSGVG